jgi:ribonuclease P protein component
MQRLQNRAQFQAVLAAGTVARTAHFALHALIWPAPTAVPANQSSEPRARPLFPTSGMWLGAMVPKRWARRAVTRNTIKRQIYALAPQYETRLPCAAYVVRLRSTFDRKQFVSATSEPLRQAVRAELELLFRQAARRAATVTPIPAARGLSKPQAPEVMP